MKRSYSSLEKEVAHLKSSLNGLEILLEQNQRLEEHVERLCEELETATNNVVKRGYLFKWRDKEIAWATRWGLRYFTLQGSSLSYYTDESEKRPHRTIDLSRCVVRHEGTKKKGAYHVFCVYLVNPPETMDDVDDDATQLSLLLRLSSDSEAEAAQWIDMLEQGCAVEEMKRMPSAMFRKLSDDYKNPWRETSTTESASAEEDEKGLLLEAPLDVDISLQALNEGDLSPVVLERVQSANKSLTRIASKQTLARKVLAMRSPQSFSQSGNRINHLIDNTYTTSSSTWTSDKKSDENRIQEGSGLRRRKGGAGAGSADAKRSTAGAGGGGRSRTYHIKRSFPASKPMHTKAGPSPLSTDEKPGVINYRGFFNLATIILLISNARIIIDTHKKYGFVPAWQEMLANWGQKKNISQWANSAPGLSLLSWVGQLLVSYGLERFYERGVLGERPIVFINLLWCTLVLVFPVYWVWGSKAHPGARMTYLFQSVVLWMKGISYHHAMRDLRRGRNGSATSQDGRLSRRASRDSMRDLLDKDDDNGKSKELAFLQEVKDIKPPFLHYPDNLTIPNVLYFSVAPTLTYQLNYPQTKGVRWSIVLTILFRMMVVSGLILFAVEQYIMPTVANSMHALHNMVVLEIMERVLKLSIPNTYVWLLVFYFYFHLWLNLLAELTTFGDRLFYRDWWNARTIDTYWRNWNIPVHNWILRHLYYPSLRLGCGRVFGTFFAFFFSAALHEVILSVPFRCLSMHAFVGMLLQAPLSFITKEIDRRFDNPFVGNAIFWLSFCVVGQPLGILLISYDRWKLAQM